MFSEMFSLNRLFSKSTAHVAVGVVLVMTFVAAAGSSASAQQVPQGSSSSRPMIYVSGVHTPFSKRESKVDLYGEVSISGTVSGEKSTVFSASEYNAVTLRHTEMPFSPNGLQDVSTTITVDLWDHWSPVFISDTHIAYGTIDTAAAPYGINKVRLGGDDGNYVDVSYVKLARWTRTALYGVNVTDSEDNPARIYGTIKGNFTQYVGYRGQIVPFRLFDRTASDRTEVWRGGSIWSSTPPAYFYISPDSRETNVTLSVDIWHYNYIFANAHIADGSVTIPPTRSKTPVEGSSNIPGPNGSVTVYWETVMETESD